MSPELIVALLASPLLVGLPAFVLRVMDSRRSHRLAAEGSTLTRLEEENARAAARLKQAEARVQELEDREDEMRVKLDAERERVSRLRRFVIENGLGQLLETEETSGL